LVRKDLIKRTVSEEQGQRTRRGTHKLSLHAKAISDISLRGARGGIKIHDGEG